MTVKPNFRAFDALLFWGQVAWVAETISDEYWYVAQGSTPEAAVENLKRGLYATAIIQLNEGHRPFNDKFPTPAEAQQRWRRALLKSQHPVMQKGKDYRFVVSVSWSNDVKVRPVPTKGRRSSGRNK